jgi:hypothetical protein
VAQCKVLHFGPPCFNHSSHPLDFSVSLLGIPRLHYSTIWTIFTTWMVCNLLQGLFLHYPHHHSPSSSMLSLAILGLYNSSVRFIVRLTLCGSGLGLFWVMQPLLSHTDTYCFLLCSIKAHMAQWLSKTLSVQIPSKTNAFLRHMKLNWHQWSPDQVLRDQESWKSLHPAGLE